jgi:beta-lactamase class D
MFTNRTLALCHSERSRGISLNVFIKERDLYSLRICSGLRAFLVLVFVLFISSSLHAKTLVLETEDGKETIITGDKDLLHQAVTPASTFKIIIAWAALEEGHVEPQTLYRVSDKHIPDVPKTISLKDALFFSSNDYFHWVFKKMGTATLGRYIEKSGWTGKPLPKDWLGKDSSAVIRGGNLLITPDQQHRFILNLMNQKVTSGKTHENLKTSLEWPSSDPQTRLFGKTGSWGEVIWFNGFGETSVSKKAVTVLVYQKGARREDGIRSFYKCWNQNMPTIFQ